MKHLREQILNEYQKPNMFCIYPHNAKVNTEVLGDAFIELGEALKKNDSIHELVIEAYKDDAYYISIRANNTQYNKVFSKKLEF